MASSDLACAGACAVARGVGAVLTGGMKAFSWRAQPSNDMCPQNLAKVLSVVLENLPWFSTKPKNRRKVDTDTGYLLSNVRSWSLST